MSNATIQIELEREELLPGDSILGTYSFSETANQERTVEIVVYWSTSGKGTEERFEYSCQTRNVPADAVTDEQNGEFAVSLPRSPLSYNGFLIKLNWYVLVRQTRGPGKGTAAEAAFRLGHVADTQEVT